MAATAPPQLIERDYDLIFETIDKNSATQRACAVVQAAQQRQQHQQQPASQDDIESLQTRLNGLERTQQQGRALLLQQYGDVLTSSSAVLGKLLAAQLGMAGEGPAVGEGDGACLHDLACLPWNGLA